MCGVSVTPEHMGRSQYFSISAYSNPVAGRQTQDCYKGKGRAHTYDELLYRKERLYDTLIYIGQGGKEKLGEKKKKHKAGTLLFERRVVGWHQHHKEDGLRKIPGCPRKPEELGGRTASRIRTATSAFRPIEVGERALEQQTPLARK